MSVVIISTTVRAVSNAARDIEELAVWESDGFFSDVGAVLVEVPTWN